MSDEPDAAAQRRLGVVRSFATSVPHNHALGIEILEVRPGETLFRMPYAAHLIGDPETGVLHGGAITTLLDGSSGAAVFAALGQLMPIATLDLRIDYLRPAEVGRAVLARATCYKLGHTVASTRAVAYHDDPADPIAHAVGTFMLGPKLGRPRS